MTSSRAAARLQHIIACLLALVVTTIAAPLAGAQAPSPVRVDAVRLEPVQQRRTVTGEIRAVHRSRVASQEEGLLATLLVTEGDRVEDHQELATIDSKRLTVEITGRQADLRAAQATIAQRQAELVTLQRDVERLKKAVRSGAANEKEVLDAQSRAAAAEASLAEAESQSASIDAAIKLLNIRLVDMTIRAPFAGVVVDRAVEVGEWLDSGDTVVEILSVNPLEAWLDVPQQLLGPALVNDSTIEILDARTGGVIAAAPARVIPVVDERARTFPLVVSVANDSGDIAPGVAVTGTAPTGQIVERLTIDRDAVLRNESGPYVYVVRGGEQRAPGTAQITPIEPLFDFDGRLVIGFGALKPGDRLVVEGNERLYPTAPVIPVEPDQAAPNTAVGRSDRDEHATHSTGG